MAFSIQQADLRIIFYVQYDIAKMNHLFGAGPVNRLMCHQD
jgi:hypothetical protein